MITPWMIDDIERRRREPLVAPPQHERTRSVSDDLVEVARHDTAFADLYVQRARELLHAEVSEAQHARFCGLDGEIANLEHRIAAAVGGRDWPVVRDLTRRAAELTRVLSEQAAIRAIVAHTWGDEILVDPFSPGISGLAGVPERDLTALRDAAVERLDRLRSADPAWADLYDARRRRLDHLRFPQPSAARERAASCVATLEAHAHSALVRGNLALLHHLSAQILEAESLAAMAADLDASRGLPVPAPALVNPFPPEACDRARRLGLLPCRVTSNAEGLRARFRPSWRPTMGDPSGSTVHFTFTVPGDTDATLREALAPFTRRAFVTSAGTRYIPWCVAEDVLVEDFDDPSPTGTADPASPLLEALGLPERRGLARNRIEKALRDRGATVLEHLGLDPREHRMVCVPVDVFARLGAKLGWGNREVRTHFDGYMASKDRKLMPLAGGDVRCGGLHDLVAVGSDQGSDRLLARFAVVQRERFATW